MTTREQSYGSGTDRVAALLAQHTARLEVLELLGGAAAAAPPPAVSTAFQHVQAVPDTVWTITHGLGYQPAVTVVDSGGDEVEGAVTFTDANTVVLTFTAAFTGTAYLS